MYPTEELSRLSAHKAALQARIGLHRAACEDAAGRVARPVASLDRLIARWRQLSPLAVLAAAPLGLIATRFVLPRLTKMATILRRGAIILGVIRSLHSAYQRSLPAPPRPAR